MESTTTTTNMKPSVCFEIQKIIGISCDGNVRNYQVQWAPTWISGIQLVGCEHLIDDFLNKQCQDTRCVVGNNNNSCSDKDNTEFLENIVTTPISNNNNNEKCKRELLEDSEGPVSMVMDGSNSYMTFYDTDGSIAAREDENTVNQTILDMDGFEKTSTSTITNQNLLENSDIYSSNQKDNNTSPVVLSFVDPCNSGNNYLSNIIHEEYRHKESIEEADINESKSDDIVVIEEDPSSDEIGLGFNNNNFNINLQSYKCTVCFQEFNEIRQLVTHQRQIHSIKSVFVKDKDPEDDPGKIKNESGTSKEVQFKCGSCRRIFRKENFFLQHKCSTCSVCGKTFTRKHDLERHVMIHSNERPYECSICRKRFNQSQTLRKHMKLHEAQGETLFKKQELSL